MIHKNIQKPIKMYTFIIADMLKKSLRRSLRGIDDGFLLPEALMASAFLTGAVLLAAHLYTASVREYARSAEHLRLTDQVSGKIESIWCDHFEPTHTDGIRISEEFKPIASGILLPKVPTYRRRWLTFTSERDSHCSIRIAAGIKEP
jgi:hypothetical protein